MDIFLSNESYVSPELEAVHDKLLVHYWPLCSCTFNSNLSCWANEWEGLVGGAGRKGIRGQPGQALTEGTSKGLPDKATPGITNGDNIGIGWQTIPTLYLHCVLLHHRTSRSVFLNVYPLSYHFIWSTYSHHLQLLLGCEARCEETALLRDLGLMRGFFECGKACFGAPPN